MCSSPFLGEDYLGQWIRVRSELTDWEFDCRITDVSADEHRDGQIARKSWLELDWDTAQQACLISRVGERKPVECPVTFWIPEVEVEVEEKVVFPYWRYEHQVWLGPLGESETCLSWSRKNRCI